MRFQIREIREKISVRIERGFLTGMAENKEQTKKFNFGDLSSMIYLRGIYFLTVEMIKNLF